MITAVDTNVLLDVFLADPEFGTASGKCLDAALRQGVLVVCAPVWAETAAVFPDQAVFQRIMCELDVRFSPLEKEAAIKAGAIWKNYRAAGGRRRRMVADFLIGAHALVQCDRLLTRDRGFYRDYFNNLKIIDPYKAACGHNPPPPDGFDGHGPKAGRRRKSQVKVERKNGSA